MDRDVRRIDLSLGLILAQNVEIHQALRYLHLNGAAIQVGDFHRGTGIQPEDIRVVELNFRARIGSGRDGVAIHQRGIHRCGYPLAGIGALDRDVAFNQTDSGNAKLRTRLPLGGLVLGVRRNDRSCKSKSEYGQAC